jgi:hypothetical protein
MTGMTGMTGKAVTVTPGEFLLVLFDHAEVVDVATRVVQTVGITQRVVIAVNENTPLQRVVVTSFDPITLDVESGALEDPRRPRKLSVPNAESALSKVLYRVQDRLDGSFADAPADDKLTNAQRSAWGVFAVGRASRAGFHAQEQRQRYGFRNRHQFSDAADAVFDRLWTTDTMTWAELESLSKSVAGDH